MRFVIPTQQTFECSEEDGGLSGPGFRCAGAVAHGFKGARAFDSPPCSVDERFDDLRSVFIRVHSRFSFSDAPSLETGCWELACRVHIFLNKCALSA